MNSSPRWRIGLGGAQMASFNFLLALAPPRRLPSYTAFYQLTQFAVTFAGPLAGGLVLGALGFQAVFAVSAAGRLAATAFQAVFLLDEEKERDPPVDGRRAWVLAGDRA
ncbi:MAG TPA: MFS transporter [Dehalococcoidia bacterium]|nr:MFS transporter [Dehalococcoidia bacterium]